MAYGTFKGLKSKYYSEVTYTTDSAYSGISIFITDPVNYFQHIIGFSGIIRYNFCQIIAAIIWLNFISSHQMI